MLTLLVADSDIQLCKEIQGYCASRTDIRLIKCVHSGKDVIACMESEPVDILLMDIVLPSLDGLGVLLQMQQTKMPRKPTVFVNTAFLDNRIMQGVQQLGVVYCFVKPMSAEYLIQRISMLMRALGLSPSGNLPIPQSSAYLNSSNPSLQEQTLQENDTNSRITRHILAVGVPAHLRGYHYLRTAILYFVEAEEPSTIAVTKDVYPFVAEQYNTRHTLVERAIRNAIEVAWTRGNTKVLDQLFGYTINDFKGKPTNAEFISMIADRVRNNL